MTSEMIAIGIEADDAGGHARQHRFGEAAALVELLIGGDEIVALLLQLLGHAVEGARQRLEVAWSFELGDLGVEIAGRDAPRRIEQAHHRRHDAVGEPQAEPDRRQKEDQRHAGIHQREGHLDARALLQQLVVFGLGGPRLVELVDAPTD